MRTGRSSSRGFAYVLLLVAIAAIAAATAGTVSLGAVAERRSAERELLAIGAEFQRALLSYAGAPANANPAQVQGPRSLEDLLKDPRTPGVRRHLRRIYRDPLTGGDEWGTVRNAQGGIVGIYSLATGRPFQQAGFATEFAAFEQADSYKLWVFGFTGTASGPKP